LAVHVNRYQTNDASASRSSPMTATAGPDNQLITVNGAAQTY
jgi:hypothetical protein